MSLLYTYHNSQIRLKGLDNLCSIWHPVSLHPCIYMKRPLLTADGPLLFPGVTRDKVSDVEHRKNKHAVSERHPVTQWQWQKQTKTTRDRTKNVIHIRPTTRQRQRRELLHIQVIIPAADWHSQAQQRFLLGQYATTELKHVTKFIVNSSCVTKLPHLFILDELVLKLTLVWIKWQPTVTSPTGLWTAVLMPRV